MPRLTKKQKARQELYRYLMDLGERIVKTFLQAFMTQIVAGGLGIIDALQDFSILQKAGLSGLVAVATLVFGLVAKWVGAPDSASFLPTRLDPPKDEGAASVTTIAAVTAVVTTLLVIIALKVFGLL